MEYTSNHVGIPSTTQGILDESILGSLGTYGTWSEPRGVLGDYP